MKKGKTHAYNMVGTEGPDDGLVAIDGPCCSSTVLVCVEECSNVAPWERFRAPYDYLLSTQSGYYMQK